MPIEATVIPQGLPQVGGAITAETFERISTPRVLVPTDNIKIDSGETMQIDGTLVINGSLIGGGLSSTVATGLGNLNDVDISSIQIGQALKWDGSKWTNLNDEGLSELSIDSLNGVLFDSPQNGEVIKFDGTRWINSVDETGYFSFSQLQDSEISNIQLGQTVSWDGSNWVNIDTPIQTTSLAQLDDVDLSNLQNLQTLQYDLSSNRWNAVGDSDFIDAIIDGGIANSVYTEGFDIDGGGA